MKNQKYAAFTLVEVLTTVAIIGILLAVLLPALNQVGKTALIVKQRAQFHTIELALEAFRNDSGTNDYPPSAWNTTEYGSYSASQRLAEALVGRDGFGFHPSSRYRRDGKGDVDRDGILDPPPPNNQTIYDVINGVAGSNGGQTVAENRAVRKGPYLELESANAVQLLDYGIYSDLVNAAQPSIVLADVFKTVKLTTGRKTGMPILYYRADRFKTGHDAATPGTNTININDSLQGIAQYTTHPTHPLTGADGATWFYRRTLNPNFTSPPRPYRAESFILHSAGPDGKYGTEDDIFNFEQAN